MGDVRKIGLAAVLVAAIAVPFVRSRRPDPARDRDTDGGHAPAGGAAGVAGPPMVDAGPSVRDRPCLGWLRARDVRFRVPGRVEGIADPVEVEGDLGPVRLVPRGRRAALMDCALARALVETGPVFAELGFEQLFFSAAYDYRTRRGSQQLSAHAHGLALDVHALSGPRGTLEVEAHFARGAGEWPKRIDDAQALSACIGKAATDEGRRLRTLVCRLRREGAFPVIITPDDDADHRDHLHLEAAPPGG